MENVEIKATTPHPQAHPGDMWVFGYGSLMWNPGFAFAEKQPAVAHGVHRRLCVYSTRYRGTPEKPGLVVGLLYGGCCHGLAFRVPADKVAETRDYLTAREQVSKIYHEVFRPVRLRDGRTIRALCYVVDQKHGQYAGHLSPEEQLQMVAHSSGSTGPNRDYVCNTARSLREIQDRTLGWLSEQLDGKNAREPAAQKIASGSKAVS
jgi:glutathione-specific gamma-glutamylcyclotransferase